jgi:hypothetical protein
MFNWLSHLTPQDRIYFTVAIFGSLYFILGFIKSRYPTKSISYDHITEYGEMMKGENNGN